MGLLSFFQGGATGQEQNQINQNRNYIYNQGQALNQQAQNMGTNYQNQAQQYTGQADQAYAPLIAGQGGYTPQQSSAILNQQGLNGLPLTGAEEDAIKGNPNVGVQNNDSLAQNYLTAGEAQGAAGDQTGINTALTGVAAAVDPNSVDTFTNNTRLTPQMQDQMATDAARSATNVDHASMDANAEAARASGADPLGVAGYTAQADRRAQQDAAAAASTARVNASQVAAGREQNILGANQTLAGQKAQAANTNLSAQQSMEANQANRALIGAENRQATTEGNAATYYNQNQAADQTASSRATQIAQNRQGQGQYVDTAVSGRQGAIANQEQGQAAEGRQYLSNQIAGTNAGAQTEQGIQSGVYGTTTGAANQSTQTQVGADQRQSGFNQFLNAAGTAAKGAASLGVKV